MLPLGEIVIFALALFPSAPDGFPRLVVLALADDETPVEAGDLLEIEERQMRLDLVALHSVQPLGVEQRTVIPHLQHINDVDRGLIVSVIMVADNIGELHRDTLGLAGLAQAVSG